MTNTSPASRLLAVAASLSIVASWANAQGVSARLATPVRIEIPAQSLAQALTEWSRQTGVSIDVAPSLLVGKTALAVAGTLTARQALERLLAGSELKPAIQAESVSVMRAGESSGTTLETVTITGSAAVPLKPETPKVGTFLVDVPLAETPYSINSIPEEFLRNRDVHTIEDVLRNVPGVQVSPSHRSADNAAYVTQRGKSATLLIDGFATTPVGLLPLELIESVDALQGPGALDQGFFGGGGGTVTLTLKRPRLDNYALVDFGVTNFGGKNVLVDISHRLDDNGQWAARVNLAAQDLRSHVRGASGHYTLGALAVDWKPMSGTLLQVEGYTQHRQETPQSALELSRSLDLVPPRIDPRLFLGYPYERFNSKAESGSLQATQDLWEGWKFKAQYRSSRGTQGGYSTYVHDFDPATGDALVDVYGFGYGTPLLVGDPRHFTNYAGEAKVYGTVTTGPLKHDLALGYSADDARYEFSSNTRNASASNIPINVYNGPITLPRPGELEVSEDTRSLQFDQGKRWGYFVQDRISYDKWSVWAGANIAQYRYSFDFGADGIGSNPKLKKTSPSYALSYQPIKPLMLYASTQQAIAEGGRAPSLEDQPLILNPEEKLPYKVTKQDEVGAKWETAGALISAAYFYIKEPFEYFREEDAGLRYVQDGRVVNKGVNLSIQGRVASGLDVLVGAQFLSAKVAKTNDAQVAGKTVAGVAEKLVNATVEYTLPWLPEVVVTGSAYYTGRFPLNDNNSLFQSGYTLFDLGARWVGRIWGTGVTFRGTVANAGNKYYVYDPMSIYVGAPRTYRLAAELKF